MRISERTLSIDVRVERVVFRVERIWCSRGVGIVERGAVGVDDMGCE